MVNFYAFSAILMPLALFLTTAVTLFLTLILIFKRNRPKIATYLIFFNLSLIGFSLAYFYARSTEDYNLALFWVRVLIFFTTWAGPTFFLLVANIVNKQKRYFFWIIFAFLTAAPTSYLALTSGAFIAGLRPEVGFQYYASPGPLFFIQVIEHAFWFIFSFALLFIAWKKSRAEQRNFIKTFTLLMLAAITGASLNYLPMFEIPVSSLTIIITPISLAFLTRLVLKGSFYEIRVFYYEFFAAGAILISIAQVALNQKLSPLVLDAVILILLLFCSIYLLRAGARERKNLETIARLNKQLNNTIDNVISSIASAVIIIDDKNKVISANQRALELFGHDKKTSPAAYEEFVRCAKNAFLDKALKEYAQTGKNKFETIIQAPRIKQIEISISPFVADPSVKATMILITDQKPPWGTVYRSDTFEPVPLAIIRVFGAKSGKMVATQVTDPMGRFGVMVEPGEYMVIAEQSAYNKGFSSKHIGYQGEAIKITKDNLMDVCVNIVLDPRACP